MLENSIITVRGDEAPSTVSAFPPLTRILPLYFLIAGVAFSAYFFKFSILFRSL